MGDTLQRVRELVRAGTVKISEHGYDELAADGISVREIVEGLQEGGAVIHGASGGADGPGAEAHLRDFHFSPTEKTIVHVLLLQKQVLQPGAEHDQRNGEADRHVRRAKTDHQVVLPGGRA